MTDAPTVHMKIATTVPRTPTGVSGLTLYPGPLLPVPSGSAWSPSPALSQLDLCLKASVPFINWPSARPWVVYTALSSLRFPNPPQMVQSQVGQAVTFFVSELLSQLHEF